MKLFALVSFAALTASARVVYVTPDGTGEKDGTSWANAYASPATAYADAVTDATAESPNEVWIKKGFYNLASNSNVPMGAHVRVYGGFAGGETSAGQADPETNWSILCMNHYAASANKYYWIDENGKSQGGVWTYSGGNWTFNPIPDGAYWRGSDCGNCPMFVDAGGDGTDNEFHGLVFTGCSKGGAIVLTAGGASVKVKKCRFIANSGYTGNSQTSVYTSGKVSLLIDGCRFEGCNGPLSFNNTTDDTELTVTNCSFVSCYSKSGTASGLAFTGSGFLQVRGCAFDRGWFSASQLAFGIYQSGGRLLARDCSFTDARSFNEGAGACLHFNKAGTTADVERCTFAGIRAVQIGDSYSAGCCMKDGAAVSGMDIRIRDSYFTNNFINCRNGSNGYRAYGCIYGMQSGNKHAFVNCTFADNTIVKSNTSSHVSMITGGYNSYWATIVNCTFRDNDCFNVSAGSVTNRIAELDFGGWGNFYMVDTVMTHTTDDYIPFVNTKPVFAATCIKNLTYPSGSIAPSLTGDPKLAEKPREKDGLLAWGVSWASPREVRTGGLRVWSGTDRRLYFRDPNAAAATPWRCLTNNGLVSDADAAAVGVSLAAEPIPDAFGAERAQGKIALGPLNAPHTGFAIFLK